MIEEIIILLIDLISFFKYQVMKMYRYLECFPLSLSPYNSKKAVYMALKL